MPSPDYKRRALEDLRASLIEDHGAAHAQLRQELSAANRVRLERQIAELEREIDEIDARLVGSAAAGAEEPVPPRQPAAGIPAALLKPLRESLLLCDELLDPAALRDLMAHEWLIPWRFSLPIMSNPQAQVGAVISHLADQYRASGENALVLFLHVLAQTHEGTHVGVRLVELAEKLSEVKGT